MQVMYEFFMKKHVKEAFYINNRIKIVHYWAFVRKTDA